ncbi:hypothetical protein [Burkholderia contaminans]|uniref:hypothetical protein n=1 Tax=Burkholderia contaminans TaxID=488447 RepID=UPI002D7FC823|nr:hypothetical protein [Burkholderia contaminans]
MPASAGFFLAVAERRSTIRAARVRRFEVFDTAASIVNNSGGGPTTRIDTPDDPTFNRHEPSMLIWAPTRKSLDRRCESEGTTVKVAIEQLDDGVFLLMRYESLDASFPTSDHLYLSLEVIYDECEEVYGIGRADWLQP